MTFELAASAPIDDRGLLLGDGLFETLLAKDGQLVLAQAHAARLQAGAAVLGLAAPSLEDLTAAAAQAIAAAGLGAGRAAVRLTLTAGSGGRGLDRPVAGRPRLLCSAAPSPPPQGPLSLALVQVRRNESSPASRLKTLAYLDNVLARREAQAAGADEAVMLNTAGRLACAAAANLFWIANGRLYTPSVVCGVLAGIMRAQVLTAAAAAGVEAAEVAAGPEALSGAEAAFVTSSLAGVRSVSLFADRTFEPHAMIEALMRRLADVS